METTLTAPADLPPEKAAQYQKDIDGAIAGFAFESDQTFEAYGHHAIYFTYGDLQALQPCGWDNDETFVSMPLKIARDTAAELSERLKQPVFLLDGDACLAMEENK